MLEIIKKATSRLSAKRLFYALIWYSATQGLFYLVEERFA